MTFCGSTFAFGGWAAQPTIGTDVGRFRPVGAIRLAVTLLVLVSCSDDRSSTKREVHSTPRMVAERSVRHDGFAGLQFGSDLVTAPRVLGVDLRPYYEPYADFETCDYVYSTALPGVAFMVRRDSVGGVSRVERIDVDSANVRTVAGVGVGDSEARILALYAGNVERAPDKLSPLPGHALLIVTVDSLHRIIFSTDGARVTSYRAGRRPAVDFGEGCA